MAVTDRTIREVLALRAALDKTVDSTTAALTQAWGRAWQEIVAEYQAAADEIVDMIDQGEYPTRRQILRSQRAANAVKAAVEAVQDLSRTASVQIIGNLDGIIATAERWQRSIAATQLPYQYGIEWARVDHRAIEAIVRRTTGRIEAATRPLPRLTLERMKAALVRGVAVGDNPNVVARQIVSRCEGEFRGGLYRARTIARTELLDASRRASDQSRKANQQVLAGWHRQDAATAGVQTARRGVRCRRHRRMGGQTHRRQRRLDSARRGRRAGPDRARGPRHHRNPGQRLCRRPHA
jgi:hypothetical protein